MDKNVLFLLILLEVMYKAKGYVRQERLQYNGCYGSTTENALVATCPVGEYIAVSDLIVGAKETSTGCPSEMTLANFLYTPETCCQPTGTDCIALYEDTFERHKTACSGRNQCIATKIPSTTHTCSATTYLPATNYMTLFYYCIEETISATMCSNDVIRGKDLFIRSYSYPQPIDSRSTGIYCECQIEAQCDQIEVVSVDMRLDDSVCSQSIILTDDSGSNIIGCSRNARFNVTRMHTSNTNHLTIKFLNGLAAAGYNGGYFLINVRSATGTAELTMRCGNEIQNSPVTVSSCDEDTNWVIWISVGAAGTFLLIHVTIFFCVRKQLGWQKERAIVRQQTGQTKKKNPTQAVSTKQNKPKRFSLSFGKKNTKVGVETKDLPDVVTKWTGSPQPGSSKDESNYDTVKPSPRSDTPMIKQTPRAHTRKTGEGIFNILRIKGFSQTERSRIPDPPEDVVSEGEGRVSPEGRAIERWASKQGGLQASQEDKLDNHDNVQVYEDEDSDYSDINKAKDLFYKSEDEVDEQGTRHDGRKTSLRGHFEEPMFMDNVSYVSEQETSAEAEMSPDDGLMNARINAGHGSAPGSPKRKQNQYERFEDLAHQQQSGMPEVDDGTRNRMKKVVDEYDDIGPIPAKSKIDTTSPLSIHLSGQEEELHAAFEGGEPSHRQIDELYDQIGKSKRRRPKEKQPPQEDRPGTG